METKETPTIPKTGDNRSPLIWLLLLGLGEGMAGGPCGKKVKKIKIRSDD